MKLMSAGENYASSSLSVSSNGSSGVKRDVHPALDIPAHELSVSSNGSSGVKLEYSTGFFNALSKLSVSSNGSSGVKPSSQS